MRAKHILRKMKPTSTAILLADVRALQNVQFVYYWQASSQGIGASTDCSRLIVLPATYKTTT